MKCYLWRTYVSPGVALRSLSDSGCCWVRILMLPFSPPLLPINHSLGSCSFLWPPPSIQSQVLLLMMRTCIFTFLRSFQPVSAPSVLSPCGAVQVTLRLFSHFLVGSSAVGLSGGLSKVHYHLQHAPKDLVLTPVSTIPWL